MANKFLLTSLVIAGALMVTYSPLTAQNAPAKQEAPVAQSSEQAQENRMMERLEQMFANEEIYTPYRARLQYQATLELQKERKNKSATLSLLTENFQYSEEELKNLPALLENEDIIQNPLNPNEAIAMEAMIQDDLPAAFAKIVSSGELNPALVPSDEKDEPLLDRTFSAVQETPKTSPIAHQMEMFKKIKTLNTPLTQSNTKKRLGKKSFNIHPDNFEYEEN